MTLQKMIWTVKYKKWAFMLIVLIGGVIPILSAQQADFKRDILTIIKKMNEKKFKAKVKYKFYNSYYSPTPIEEKNLIASVWGNNVFYQMGPMLSILNSSHTMLIDFDQKIILVNKNLKESSKKEADKIDMMHALFLDSMMKNIYTVSIVSDSIQTQYRVKYHVGYQVDHLDVFLNKASSQLQKIDIYYAENMKKLFDYPTGTYKTDYDLKAKPRLTIVYENITYLTKFNSADYSMDAYLLFSKNGKVSLQEKYKGYRLDDYTLTKKGKKKKRD